MKYYLIAGERSGDLHGSYLIKALKEKDPEAQVRCWGGSLMQQAGGDLVVHYENLAFMGIWEVMINLLTIKRYLDRCQKDLVQYQPQVLVLIDYPGFNLNMAAFAHKRGIPVCYYISPKIWAWNQKRIFKIKKYVDRMFVILPFEKQFYDRFHYPVDFVGNPLVETISKYPQAQQFKAQHNLDHRPLIAVLPGSRKQEISQMLGVMLELVIEFPHHAFVVAAVDNIPRDFYKKALDTENVVVVTNQTYDLLSVASAALVASGTASLETAIFNVPQVVCYKTSWLTYWLARLAIKVKYISLVNLIADAPVVPELIQGDFRRKTIARHLREVLTTGVPLTRQQAGYRKVRMLLGNKNASQETARHLVAFLRPGN